MEELKFEVNKNIKIETSKKMAQGGKSKKKINGKVCEVHERYIVVQTQNYKECFLISSFVCGDLNIVGGNS